MSRPSFFYRNARSGELLELFLVSAISTLLLVRFFLHVTGYPSVGGSRFHIAHLLYGGALLTAAAVLLLAFIGSRIQRLASVVGGIGFGLFIDELGKFITRDNNYFFQPTIALIYVVFVLLFVLFRFLSQVRRLTPTEYLLNAVALTQEVVINDLEADDRRRALRYLDRADQSDPLVAPLRRVLATTKADSEPTTPWQRWRQSVERAYEHFVTSRFGLTTIDTVFIIKTVVFLVTVVGSAIQLWHHDVIYHLVFVPAVQLTSTAISAMLVTVGVVRIWSSRLLAYNLFSKSLLVDLLVTQFFSFYRYQLSALPGFLATLALYLTVRFLLRQERRFLLRHPHPRPQR
jgi:hypothetical protein